VPGSLVQFKKKKKEMIVEPRRVTSYRAAKRHVLKDKGEYS